MAINYSAGFLPQQLYQNMFDAQRAGLEERNRREREQFQNLGNIAGAFIKNNVDMGDKAKEEFTKDYETRRKRLTDTMANLDPRSGDYGNYRNALANLDSEYTNKIKSFRESGFIGSLGRDRGMLGNLTDYEPGSYSPDSTTAAYALQDAKQKLVDAGDVRIGNIPREAMATAQGNMAVGMDPDIQNYEQMIYDRDSGREQIKADADQKRQLARIAATGQNSIDVANIQAAGALERAKLNANNQDAINAARLNYLNTQIAGEKELNAARLRNIEATTAGKTATQTGIKDKDLLTMARNIVKDRYADSPIDPVTYEDEITSTFNGLKAQFSSGGASTGSPTPTLTADSLYESSNKKEKDSPKITTLTKTQYDQLEAQVRYMEDRADGTFGFGSASPEMQKYVSTLATNMRQAIEMYNKTPDSDTERKKLLRTRLNQYSKAINEVSQQLR